MPSESKKKTMSMVAMQIILHAGDAKIHVYEALDKIKEFDFTSAIEEMKKADEEIVAAHKIQTAMVQDEAAGNDYPNSLLFNHAQDTLMTVISNCEMAKKVIDIAKAISIANKITIK